MCIATLEIDYRHTPQPAGKNYISSTFTHDYLMIDSGAQACVCSPDYYPDIAVVPLLPEHTPQLRTVTGASMKCHGVKYVDYILSRFNRMTVRYYVCDGVNEPVISVSGLLATGYSLHLSNSAWLER